ncbi:GGDEF domain-containing protein [Lacticaseibacillus suihuaensis]
MTTSWLLLTFVLTLITNITVFYGVLALLYWLGDVLHGFGRGPRATSQLLLAVAYLAYLFAMSVVNTHYDSAPFGLHWTYLNLLVVAAFIFNLLMNRRVVAGFTSLMLIGYFGGIATRFTPVTVGGIALAVAIMWGLTRFGRSWWHRRGLVYPLMVGFGATAMVVAWQMVPTATDVWFWVRQLLALALEFTFVYEYARMVVARRQAMDHYQREATRDQLTGVRNFGTFNQDLAALYGRYQATGAKFAVYELDLDRFKAINDTYGHLVGNTVLKRVAAEILQVAAGLEYSSAVYRMGGEEFCLVLRDVTEDRARAAAIARDLKARIGALRFTAAGDDFGLTVSIGQERITAEDRNYLDIYNRVDQFLYEAKRAGRNAINLRGTPLPDTDADD